MCRAPCIKSQANAAASVALEITDAQIYKYNSRHIISNFPNHLKEKIMKLIELHINLQNASGLEQCRNNN